MHSFTTVAVVLTAGLAAAAPIPDAAAATSALYQPLIGDTWGISLSDVWTASTFPDADVIEGDMEDTPQDTIAAWKAKGKKFICYFSAGSYEAGRSDASKFQASDIGNKLDGWDEQWLDTTSANVRSIMAARIQVAQSKGCDAIDPDNVDGYDNGNTGFPLTEATATDYVKFLSSTAAGLGLSTFLKNAEGILSGVSSDVVGAVNEQCHQYGECDNYDAFIASGKAVFNIEYPDGGSSSKRKRSSLAPRAASDSCSSYQTPGIATLLKALSLPAANIAACPIVLPSGGVTTPAPVDPAPAASASSSATASAPTATTTGGYQTASSAAVPSATAPVDNASATASATASASASATAVVSATGTGAATPTGTAHKGHRGHRNGGNGNHQTRSDEDCDVEYI